MPHFEIQKIILGDALTSNKLMLLNTCMLHIKEDRAKGELNHYWNGQMVQITTSNLWALFKDSNLECQQGT